MDMLEAMKTCEPYGYVARYAYPNVRFYKNRAGVFPDAHLVSRLDYFSTDWQAHPPVDDDTRLGETYLKSNQVGVRCRCGEVVLVSEFKNGACPECRTVRVKNERMDNIK